MQWRLIIFSFAILLSFSCHKEYSCEGNCVVNPPTTPAPAGNSNSPQPVITALNCATGSFSASAVEANAYSGQFTTSYSGGNGGTYNADTIMSTGVSGLTAILTAGTLAHGNGSLVYVISGTPAAPGSASFHFSLGGKDCIAVLLVDPAPIILSGIKRMPIAVEKEHNLVVLPNGTVKAWGANQFGELGDGTTTQRQTPIEITSLNNIAAVAAGGYHSLALTNDGKVWAWGRNNMGQLGDGTSLENHVPKLIIALSNIISIAAGFECSLALKNDGTVWAWGGNLWGTAGDASYINKFQPTQVNGLTGIIAIAAGTEHCLALKNDGTVWSWGWNANGCLGDGSTIVKRATPAKIPALSDITAIAANGSIHSLALKRDGTVWTWGSNFYGQLGDGTNVEKSIPLAITSLSHVVTIGTGESHSFAVKDDGSLWDWGWNGNGQLGVDFNFESSQPIPVNVPLLPGAKIIAGGSYHSLAQRIDGSIYTMGGNVYGQLGDGSGVVSRFQPMVVAGL